jgi:hypothetical protein
MLTTLSSPALLSGQEIVLPAPEELFAPGIEVVSVEPFLPYTPTFNTPTPSPTLAPRCGFVPYLHFGETEEWLIDYEVAPSYTSSPIETPLILCNQNSGERRELQTGEPVEAISISPNQHYAVWSGTSQYFGYDFRRNLLISIGRTRNADNRTVIWYGNTTVLIYESDMPDSSVWRQVFLADVTTENSLVQLASILKQEDVPRFAHYTNPDRTAWVEYTDDRCSMNWIMQATGERESFDITDICVVGTPLTDDPYEDYLFTPIRYRVVQEEAEWQLVEAYARDLIRMNLTSGERDVWYSGEVERLNDLDPSQRYATLILDDNGCIDLISIDQRRHNDLCMRSEEATDYETPEFEVALLDTTSHEIIYRHPVEDHWREGFERRVFDIDTGEVYSEFYNFTDPEAAAAGDLFSLGENLFVFFHRELANPRPLEGPLRFVNDIFLDVKLDNTITETTVPGQILLAGQANTYFVLLNTDRNLTDTYLLEADLLLYDQQGNTFPFIPNVEAREDIIWGTDERYRVNLMRGNAPNELQVRLWGLEGQGEALYTIRVPR